jgi:hypothetical protein
MLSREILIDAIERSDSMLPEIPGHNQYVRLPGVLLCVSPTNDPHANKALLARLSSDNVDAAIERVLEHFGSMNKCFSWIVGPSSTPGDLSERLTRRGFETMLGADGLCLPDLNPPIAINDAVRIVELSPDDLEPAVHISAVGFGSSVEDSRVFHEMVALSAPAVIAHVCPFRRGRSSVACGCITYFPDQPIALLCGGATLPEYRGKGIYRTMLAHRLADIRCDGIESVILLADQRTSSPICIRNGFVKLCDLQFIWRRDRIAAGKDRSSDVVG